MKKIYSLLVLMALLISGNVIGQSNYKLITSTSDLVAGEKYVIGSAYTGSTYLLGYQNTNNRPQSGSYTINSSVISATVATVNTDHTNPYEITLGGSTGAWILTDAVNSSDLKATSNSNNYLQLSTGGTWTITFSANAAVITCTNGGTRNLMSYNSSSSLFSCYISGQAAIYLYRKCYKITYDGNSNTSGSVPTDANSYFTGATATVLANTGTLARTGYTFAGWNTAADGSGTDYAATGSATLSMPSSNVTLYAKWTSVGGHTVTFNTNGGTGTMSPQNASTPTNLTANTFTRTGYTFTGWNTIAGGGGTAYADGASYSFAADITLYAQWSVNSYTVTFNANGGTGSPSVSSVSGNYNSSVTLATIGTLAKTGYTFGGWNTAADGSGTNYAAGGSYTVPANNIILYAKWTPNNYQITFDKNNGSATGTMSNQTIAYGATAALTANAYSLSGYVFDGWATSAAGAVVYTDGANYTMGLGNVTLYAHWSVGPCQSDNFDSGYGNWTGGTGTYNNNTAGYTGNGVGFNTTADDIITTNAITGASSITFVATASSNSANFTLKVQYSTSAAGPWTDITTLTANGSNTGTVTDSWKNYNYSISPIGIYYLRFVMSARSGGSFYLDNVNVFCSALPPTITPATQTFTGFTYASGSGPSASQNYALNATYLSPATSTVTITASTNYEVSLNGTVWSGVSVTTPAASGGALAFTVYARLKAGLAVGNYNGETIAISGGGATASLTVSGNVTPALFTSVANGDWFTASTWDKNAVPGGDDNVIINHAITMNSGVTRNNGTTTTINASHSLALRATYTNNGTTTVNGTLQIDGSGYANGTTNISYAATGSYLVFNSGTGPYGITAGQRFWPGAGNIPENVQVNTGTNVNLNDGTKLIPASGTLLLYGGFQNANASGLTLNGTINISPNGYFSINSPNYGAASKLWYNTNSTYGNGLEWTSAANPANVQLSNNTVLNYPTNTGARTLTGNLTIDAGSALYMDYGSPFPGAGLLTVGGNLVMNGNMSLGNNAGGDLAVKGNWTKGATAAFNPNGRLVTCNGTVNQTITGATDFAYFTINNNAGVTLASAISVNNTADFILGKISLGNNNFSLKSGGSTTNAKATSYVIINGTGKFIKEAAGNTATLIPIGISANYTPLTITNTGTVRDLSMSVKTPLTNAPFDATKVVNLEWSVLASGAGAVANITYQWNAANQAVSFSPAAASEVSNYVTAYTVVGTGTPAGSNPYTLSASGLTIPAAGTNLYIIANRCASAQAAAPSGTISGTTPACTSTSLTITPSAAGMYWQTAANGTSTANAATSSLTVNATGNFYVRSFDGTCWSAATAAYPVTINATPAITLQPIDVTVTSPATAVFNVTATGAGYQWQWYNTGTSLWEDLTNTAPYSNVTTDHLTISPSAEAYNDYEYRCIIKGAAPCPDLISNSAILTVLPGPCLSEGFETGLPSSYSTGTVTLSSGTWNGTQIIGGTNPVNINSGSRSLQVKGTSGAGIISPNLTSPNTISFWGQANSSTSVVKVSYRINAGAWIDVPESPYTFTTTYTQFTATINSTSANTQFRFLYSSGNVFYIDDVEVFCQPPTCVTSTTISSFTPDNGPVGTLVTITGTDFTGISNVKFGNKDAASFTIVNNTTITAVVPLDVPAADKITLIGSPCNVKTTNNFTLIDETGSCGVTGSGTVTDLFISEVYDAKSGSLSYIEVFNGTASSITLTNSYQVRIVTGTSTINDFDLTGTLASGATQVMRVGTSTSLCSVTSVDSYPGASGFNGNDRIYLLKKIAGTYTAIDYVPNPNYPGSSAPGFSQYVLPNATHSRPNLTYYPVDWVISNTENCSNLGVAPYTFNGTTIDVTTQPASVDCNQTLDFSVAATIAPSGTPVYVWYYNAPGTNTWNLVSGLGGGLTITGSGTNHITITGPTAFLANYQFYASISQGSPGCYQPTHATQYTYESRPIYRSKATGNWSDKATWEMSNDGITWKAACTYPIAINSSKINITAPYTVTQDIDADIDVNNLTVDAAATLITNPNAGIKILDGGAGADFIINGTFNDNNNTANSLGFGSGATWKMGANGTLLKTNSSGVAGNYGTQYETGISNIPATALWIYRYTGAGNVNTAASNMYYPNLKFESTSGPYNWSTSTTALTGASGGTMYVKGNLDIGTSGTGTVKVSYNNINTLPMQVAGNVSIGANSELTNISWDNIVDATHGHGTGIDVKGNLTVNGTLTLNSGAAQTGDLVFSGTAAQTVSGSGQYKLEDVKINNTGSGNVVIDCSFGIPGTLSFDNNAAKLSLNTGDITLQSGAVRTANVGKVPSGTTINYSGAGRFIVERYILTPRKWQFLSVPNNTLQTINQAWQEGKAAGSTTQTTPAGYGTQISTKTPSSLAALQALGFDFYSPGGPSMKSWNTATQNYVAPANTFLSIVNPAGYMLFVRGDRTQAGSSGSSTTIMRTRGQLLTGTQPAISIPAGKDVSIGNPYASALDMRTTPIPAQSVQTFYVWDPRLTGNYNLGGFRAFTKVGSDWVSTPGGGAYGGRPNFIPSGQAFFIKGGASNGNLVIDENAKGGDDYTATFVADKPQLLRVNLLIRDNSELTLTDGVMMHYQDGFNDAVDNNDGPKQKNLSEVVSIRYKNKLYAVMQKSPVADADTIFLNLEMMKARNYSWVINAENMDLDGRRAWLVDNYAQTKTALALQGDTRIDFTIANNPASLAADRFMIVFKLKKRIQFISIEAKRNADKTATVKWQVAPGSDIRYYEVERSNEGTNFNLKGVINTNDVLQYDDATAPAGEIYYRVKGLDAEGDYVYSDKVKLDALPVKTGIDMVPNPIENGIIRLQFTNEEAGEYQLVLYAANGQQMLSRSQIINNYIQQVNIKTGKLAAGTYQLLITRQDGFKQTLTVLIK